MSERALIIKTSALGDIVQAFSALSYLKAVKPSLRVDWMVEADFRELIDAHPLIDRTVAVSTKTWRKRPFSCSTYREMARCKQSGPYDVIFDLQGNLKSALLGRLVRGGERIGFGWSYAAEWPNPLFQNRRFNPPPGQNIRCDYLSLMQSRYPSSASSAGQPLFLELKAEEERVLEEILTHPVLAGGERLLVSPGSRWDQKKLPVGSLLLFLKRFSGCRFLFLWKGAKEREQAERLASHFPSKSLLLDPLSLPLLQRLMGRVDLVLAMDSLPLHLAGTTGTPTISFFGPSLAGKYRPLGPLHLSYQGTCPYGVSFSKRCPYLKSCPTTACIKEISEQELDRFFSLALKQFERLAR